MYRSRVSKRVLVAHTKCVVGEAVHPLSGKVLWMSLTQVKHFDDGYTLNGRTSPPTFIIHTMNEQMQMDDDDDDSTRERGKQSSSSSSSSSFFSSLSSDRCGGGRLVMFASPIEKEG